MGRASSLNNCKRVAFSVLQKNIKACRTGNRLSLGELQASASNIVHIKAINDMHSMASILYSEVK